MILREPFTYLYFPIGFVGIGISTSTGNGIVITISKTSSKTISKSMSKSIIYIHASLLFK